MIIIDAIRLKNYFRVNESIQLIIIIIANSYNSGRLAANGFW